LAAENARLLLELGMPIVSIARSFTKLTIESPFIGGSVARALGRAITIGPGSRTTFGRTLVIGFGPVGRATVSALADLPHANLVDVLDTDIATASAINAAGAEPLHELPAGRSYDLVVGCTGYASFPLYGRFLLADEAVLASGSSGAVEFNREGFIELADADEHDSVEVADRADTLRRGIHTTIIIRDNAEGHERVFSFLNAGFPVNFDGAMECVPAVAIQATHGLMLAACHQALRSRTPGLHSLDPAADRLIAELAVGFLLAEPYS